MKLLRTAALGGLAYGLWHLLRGQQNQPPAAFAHGQAPGPNVAKVRDAGPEAVCPAHEDPGEERGEEGRGADDESQFAFDRKAARHAPAFYSHGLAALTSGRFKLAQGLT